MVPSKISDTTLGYAVKYRSKGRIPGLVYLHWANLVRLEAISYYPEFLLTSMWNRDPSRDHLNRWLDSKTLARSRMRNSSNPFSHRILNTPPLLLPLGIPFHFRLRRHPPTLSTHKGDRSFTARQQRTSSLTLVRLRMQWPIRSREQERRIWSIIVIARRRILESITFTS